MCKAVLFLLKTLRRLKLPSGEFLASPPSPTTVAGSTLFTMAPTWRPPSYDDKATQPDWSELLGEDTIAEMAAVATNLLVAETFSASSDGVRLP